MRVHREGGGWGYPENEFFAKLHPKLSGVTVEKLGGAVLQLGSRAGGLSHEMARTLKLRAGLAVAAGNIDAHAGVPACGVTKPGTLAMIMGTSTCHLLVAEEKVEAEGICGVVQDGIIPGYWGYEAGQSGVGDVFAWFVKHACPAYAGKNEASAHRKLSEDAAKVRPGESGLLALDWWNGSRSILVNADLTGLLMGLTIHSQPHEIYRALIEATAFGTRKIVDAFTSKGVAINKIVASGGLAQKNEVLMQIYADVLQRPIEVAAAKETSALGAAMWASVAGGVYKDIHSAARRMVRPAKVLFRPNRQHAQVYDRLYAEYSRLHDFFGREATSPMRVVREIQKAA